MCAFNSAAIFYPGHPYIESTTVLSDYKMVQYSYTSEAQLAQNQSAVVEMALDGTETQ